MSLIAQLTATSMCHCHVTTQSDDDSLYVGLCFSSPPPCTASRLREPGWVGKEVLLKKWVSPPPPPPLSPPPSSGLMSLLFSPFCPGVQISRRRGRWREERREERDCKVAVGREKRWTKQEEKGGGEGAAQSVAAYCAVCANGERRRRRRGTQPISLA